MLHIPGTCSSELQWLHQDSVLLLGQTLNSKTIKTKSCIVFSCSSASRSFFYRVQNNDIETFVTGIKLEFKYKNPFRTNQFRKIGSFSGLLKTFRVLRYLAIAARGRVLVNTAPAESLQSTVCKLKRGETNCVKFVGLQ